MTETPDILATRYVNGALTVLRRYTGALATEGIRLYAEEAVRAYHAEFLVSRGIYTPAIEPPAVTIVAAGPGPGQGMLFLVLGASLKRYLRLEDMYD